MASSSNWFDVEENTEYNAVTDSSSEKVACSEYACVSRRSSKDSNTGDSSSTDELVSLPPLAKSPTPLYPSPESSPESSPKGIDPVLESKTLSLVKSRVDRLRSDFSLVNERLDRMRLMQQVIMRAVVDQGTTSKTNRAYTVIYVTDGQLGDNRRDIARLEGLTLMGFMTVDQDSLTQTRAYPMGIGCEERKYKVGGVALDYSHEGVDSVMEAELARDEFGDYYIDFSESVWPLESMKTMEFCFNYTLELMDED